MRAIYAVLPALVAGSALPAPLNGQNLLLDEGTFVLTENGTEIGSESFSIRRAGSGADTRVIARGEIRIDDSSGRRDMAPALQASGAPPSVSAYQIKISGDLQEDITVQLSGRRFVATVKSERGERVQEFRASENTFLFDDEVAHHFYFLGSLPGGGPSTTSVIVPRSRRQLAMTITDLGFDPVDVARRSVRARHVRVQGGGQTRDVWFDDEGRVLIVENPDTGYRAVREVLPT